MARLPYADSETASSAVREALDRHPVAFLRMLAHADSAFDPWLRYTRALMGGLDLDPLHRELAILQVSRLRESEYQWLQHVALARAVGASAAQIAAVKDGRDEDPSLTQAQQEVLGFARQVALEGAAGEQAVEALAELVGPRAVVELLLVIGQWLAICSIVGTLGLQPDLPAMASALPDTLALREDPAG